MVSLRLVAGLLVFCVGIALVLMPDSVPALPLANLFVLATSFILIFVGLTAAARTLGTDLSSTEAPVVERPVDLPHPGSDVEEQLEVLSVSSVHAVSGTSRTNWIDVSTQFRIRLHRLTVSVLVDHGGLTETEATEAVDAGVWSENPHAVAFFTGGYPAETPLSVRTRIELVSGTPSVATQAGHVIDELRAITQEDQRPRRQELLDALETEGPETTNEGGEDER